MFKQEPCKKSKKKTDAPLSYYWWCSVKFRVHVNVEWLWFLKLKGQVIQLQKNLLSLNCSWSVGDH